MGDENPIRTLGDYSKPSHEGYKNTIELPEGNNVVPLRSDTIRLVQNGCSFHGHRSEDPNQHLKDFLKLVDSLSLDVANRERTLLRLFKFSLRDQASNWLEHLPARSISTWEDLTTRFLAQFFPPGRTAKLRNDIAILDLYDHVNPATRRTIDQSAGGKLRDRNDEESWALLEDLALYDNESWNDPRDFAKPVKAISLPQDVPSTSDRRLIKLENQVQRLMEAHLAPKKPIQVNKITSSYEICSGPHDTQYENLEQAFVDYASSRNNEVGGRHYQAKLERTLSEFDSYQERRLSSPGAQLGRQQDDMINKINILWKVFSKKLDNTSTHDTVGDSMAHVNAASTDQIEKEELRSKGIKSPSKLLSPKYLSQASLEEQNRNPSSPKRVHFINSVVILRKKDEVREEENVKPNATECNDHGMPVKAEEKVEEESEDEFEEEIEEEEEDEEEDVIYSNTFPSLEELRYHEWLLKYPKRSWVNAKIKTESLNNVKFSCMIGHFVKKQAYIDLESPVNVMSRLHYNWIMSDTTSIIDHDLGAVVFGKPFVENIGLIYDKKEGTTTFEDNNEKLIFKMPHKMEMFKNVDFTGVNTDMIPPFVIGDNEDDNEKTHYSDTLNLRREYKYDESKRELFQDLAPLLWNSFGTIAALLQSAGSKSKVKKEGELNAIWDVALRILHVKSLAECVMSDCLLFFKGSTKPSYVRVMWPEL
ncbi:MAK10-like protein [Tanacetum coccineum]